MAIWTVIQCHVANAYKIWTNFVKTAKLTVNKYLNVENIQVDGHWVPLYINGKCILKDAFKSLEVKGNTEHCTPRKSQND